MSSNATSAYLQQEELGQLNYLSGYMPLTTPQGAVLGYLNLPYFAGEKDLKEDINSIVQALMNIYLLLFLLAMGLAGFISSRLSEPLKLLQGKLSALNFGKNNELLEWNRKDEIGDLISQYNRMVLQLADSAERLAMSERESAWKEMAKQVAHEIKNPLTPMKLGVQHLQKAVQEKAPDLDLRIERFTRNMVEQIDTLSRIASEFSDFARLPDPVKEPINLVELIAGITETFKSDPAYDVSFSSSEKEIMINGDRNQILRVFNNILKNSIQAIPDDRRGSISVTIQQHDHHVEIAVEDNGIGIPGDIGERIFTPKFTTKSGGMGLGLAMVKSIVESHNGSISFQSEPGSGTTFFITLPTIK
jgi:nitrogen fixation/metabolism regulation signal transduction histidine kinase